MIAPALLALLLLQSPPPPAPPARGERAGERGAFVILIHETRSETQAAQLAQRLEHDGHRVLRVDLDAHLAKARPGRCVYLAGDLESLAQGEEKRRGFPQYLRPVLVGLDLGANAAKAALEQAPAGTFHAAVLSGLRPDRTIPALCKAKGPASAPIVAVPDAAAVPAAVEKVAAPEPAPPAPPKAEPVADLPLVEVPSPKPGKRFAVLLTGDGGWAGLDRELSAALADAGVPVVGLDSLKYFWKRRTPEETAEAVARIVRHYRAAWGRDEVLLVGYSRGADLVPFLPPRLPEDVRGALRLVAMLGPGTFAEFEVHAIDIFTSKKRGAALSTARAVEAIGEVPVLCVQGADEHDSLCPEVAGRPRVRREVLTGGHHFDGDYGRLAGLILDAAGPP